jgi:hypothetical protein
MTTGNNSKNVISARIDVFRENNIYREGISKFPDR